jgi:hypothetical protein
LDRRLGEPQSWSGLGEENMAPSEKPYVFSKSGKVMCSQCKVFKEASINGEYYLIYKRT